MFKFTVALALLVIGVTKNHRAEALPNSAANFLSNPGFENGLSRWQEADPTLVDWIVDASFLPPMSDSQGIGAAAIFSGGPRDTLPLSQCVPVSASVLHSFSAWAMTSCPNAAFLQVDWSADETCTSVFSTDSMTSSRYSGSWQKVEFSVDSPSGAQSALVSMGNNNACFDAVIFDDVFFGDRIFSDSFD